MVWWWVTGLALAGEITSEADHAKKRLVLTSTSSEWTEIISEVDDYGPRDGAGLDEGVAQRHPDAEHTSRWRSCPTQIFHLIFLHACNHVLRVLHANEPPHRYHEPLTRQPTRPPRHGGGARGARELSDICIV